MNLTDKERRIIELMVQGYKGKQMQSEIGLSKSRIHVLIARMKRRFDYGNNEQFCIMAYKNGVIK